MNLTAKSRYALKIMMDLADHADLGLQQRHRIAERQHIPLDFMDQILTRLRHAELVESIRGRSGGFLLKRPAVDITLWDIFAAVEDSMLPVRCMTDADACPGIDHCISFDTWGNVFARIRGSLSEITLADEVRDWQRRKPMIGDSIGPVYSECRGPGRPPA